MSSGTTFLINGFFCVRGGARSMRTQSLTVPAAEGATTTTVYYHFYSTTLRCQSGELVSTQLRVPCKRSNEAPLLDDTVVAVHARGLEPVGRSGVVAFGQRFIEIELPEVECPCERTAPFVAPAKSL